MRLNNVHLLLLIVILIQSCVAYQATPTTLNTVVNKGPVKLIDNQGKVYKFKSVELKDGQYFGTGDVYSDLDFTITSEGALSTLDSANFSSIYLKDVKKSKRQSIWLGVGITSFAILVVLTVIAAIQLSNF